MADGDASDFEAQYAQIRQQFVNGLPRRLQEMAQASGPKELLAVLHRLAGAAGSFGFEALGQLAREAMAATQAQDAALKALCLSKLESAMHDLGRIDGPCDTI